MATTEEGKFQVGDVSLYTKTWTVSLTRIFLNIAVFCTRPLTDIRTTSPLAPSRPSSSSFTASASTLTVTMSFSRYFAMPVSKYLVLTSEVGGSQPLGRRNAA